MPTSGAEWIDALATRLQIAPPTPEEVEILLELRGSAAHASERIAAPISCWLVARAGLSPEAARDEVQRLAEEFPGTAGA